MRRWQGILLGLVLVAGLARPPVLVAAESEVFLPVMEDELLILRVQADRYLASDGLIGYLHDGQVLLPVGELASVLEYAVLSYPRRGVAEGWLVDESRTFSLDVAARRVTVGERQLGIDSSCLYVNEYDIYVTSDVLSTWWPLDFEMNLAQMQVVVHARETVPLVNRLKREQEWERLQRSQPGGAAEYPRHQAPYRLASWPFLEASAALNKTPDRTDWSGSLLSRGDLARLSVTGFFSADSRQDDWYGWLRGGRTDREAGLLGPLRATEFTVGDVTSPSMPLIGGTQRGRGLRVTNQPLGAITQFDAVDITGDAPPGWQIELYSDGTLYSIQTASAEGHYLFPSVPLHVGLNTLRAVMYGPNGQKREQVHTYNIRSGMRSGGTLQYDVSAVERGESILGTTSPQTTTTGTGEWGVQGELRYGLSTRTTVGAGFAQSYVQDGRRDYVLTRVLQSLGPIYLQAVGAKDLQGGQAGQVAAQTSLGEKRIYLNYVAFDDFISERNQDGEGLQRSMSARVAGALGRTHKRLLNYRFKFDRSEFGGDTPRAVDYYAMYLGGDVGGVNVGNELGHRQSQGTSTTLGQIYAAGYLLGARVRGQANYNLGAGRFLESVGATGSYRFTTDLRGQLSVARSFMGTARTVWQGNLDWELAPVRLGLQAGLVGSAWNVGLSASTSLTRAPEGGWVMSGRRIAQYGAALVTAYVDQDRDGVYGGGDNPLAEVGFRGNPLWQDIRTAEDGQAFLPGVQADRFVDVEVDYNSVPDPYLVPVDDGLTTIVHAGGVSDLEFPFRYVGEVEGVVSRDAAMSRPLRNIGLEIIDADTARVAAAVSEFDGYYLFQKVPPGEYWIRVVESTLQGRPYLIPDPVAITVPASGGFVPGPTIVLQTPDDMIEPELESEPIVPPEPAVVFTETEDVAAVVAQAEARREDTVAAGSGQVTASVDTGVAAPAPADDQLVARSSDSASRAARRTELATNAPGVGDPDLNRSLHLIYELLFDSQLFAGGQR